MNISTISAFFFALAFLGVIWFIVTSKLIYNALCNRNIDVSFLWIQFMILKYASQYREITLRETGKVGPLFYHWIISINTAWFALSWGICSRLFKTKETSCLLDLIELPNPASCVLKGLS